MSRTTLLISGMKSNHCREAVAGALERIPGVSEVDVNLFRARVTILYQGPCTEADLVRAVFELGFAASSDAEDGASSS